MAKETPTPAEAKGRSPIRTILILILAVVLGYSLLKDNPKFQKVVQSFTKQLTDAQISPADGVITIGGGTMGTTYRIMIAQAACTGPQLHDIVAPVLEGIDASMSTYRPDSDVSKFNVSDSTDWVEVSSQTAAVAALALEVSQMTGGAFDVTVGPLVDLWRFGPDKTPLTSFPTDEEIAALREHCGWDKLSVQLDPPALKKADPALHIDFSAIAKGYSVDSVAEALEANGIENYLVEVGGEVRCAGMKGELPWTLAIEKPLPAPAAVPKIYAMFRPGASALATSGNGRNFSILGTKRFSHIIDPRTGAPTEMLAGTGEFELGSVSVFDPSCAKADAFATAMFVLGEEDGLKLANELGLAVIFVCRSVRDQDLFTEVSSDNALKISKFVPTAPQSQADGEDPLSKTEENSAE